MDRLFACWFLSIRAAALRRFAGNRGSGDLDHDHGGVRNALLDMLTYEFVGRIIGIGCAFVVLVALIAGGIWLTANGHAVGGLATIATTLATLNLAFVAAQTVKGNDGD